MTVTEPGDDRPRRGQAGTDPTVSRDRQAAEVRKAAFTAFYREHVDRLVTFLRYQGAHMDEAADIAQDTLIKLYAEWDKVDHPRAWTRTVAAREFVRRRSTVREDATAEVPEPRSALVRPDADLQAVETKHEILRLLPLLPWRQRQVMAWTMDEFTPTEIAEELGISPDAVRASLKLARRALAEHVSPRKDRP